MTNRSLIFLSLQKLGYPQCWKGVLFVAAAREAPSLTASKPLPTKLPLDSFTRFWRRMAQRHHDEASQFAFILACSSSSGGGGKGGGGASRAGAGPLTLVAEDLVQLVQDVVDTHPGLGFLKEATEFHSRYVHTVRRKEGRRRKICIRMVEGRRDFKACFTPP